MKGKGDVEDPFARQILGTGTSLLNTDEDFDEDDEDDDACEYNENGSNYLTTARLTGGIPKHHIPGNTNSLTF